MAHAESYTQSTGRCQCEPIRGRRFDDDRTTARITSESGSLRARTFKADGTSSVVEQRHVPPVTSERSGARIAHGHAGRKGRASITRARYVAVCVVSGHGYERKDTHHRLMMSSATTVDAAPLGRPSGSNQMIQLAPAVARAVESTGSTSCVLKCSPLGDAAAVAGSGRVDARSEGRDGRRGGRGLCHTASFSAGQRASTGGGRAASRRRSGASNPLILR